MVTTQTNLLFGLFPPIIVVAIVVVFVIVFVIVVVISIFRQSIRLRWMQLRLNRRQTKLTSGDKVVIFCADDDAADAESRLAAPIRQEGAVVKLEHGVEWNRDDAAVVDAIAAAVDDANAVIFMLANQFLAGGAKKYEEAGGGGGGGSERVEMTAGAPLQNQTARDL